MWLVMQPFLSHFNETNSSDTCELAPSVTVFSTISFKEWFKQMPMKSDRRSWFWSGI